MKKVTAKDINNDDSIHNIPYDQIDKDFDDINLVVEVGSSTKSRIFPIILGSIIGLIIISIICFCMYVVINMNIVEGHVVGSEYTIGNFSFVSKSYDPTHFVQDGKHVYYDGNNDSFLNFKNNFSYGYLTRVYNDRYYISADGIKEKALSKAQVNYVLE